MVLKTANSGFEGYLKDSLTTLPETADRLFGTSMRAQWKYQSAVLPFEQLAEQAARDADPGLCRA